jgi:putative CocE/NonD family hydrolase
VAAQPWFDGRLVMWGASYLGMTQWAVAQDAPDFLRALSLQVTAANFRDSVVFPGGAFALETGLAWLHEIKNQELGWRTVLRSLLDGPKVVRASSEVLPLGKCDSAAIGEPMPFFQEWLRHATPGDGWWDEVDFGRRLDNVPPASFIGGWYDLFLRAQVDDYQALRHAGRPARLTIGPWTHGSPGLFAETVRDGPQWFDSQLGAVQAGRDEAPVRLFVMGSRTWQEFSMWPPAGKTEQWYLGRGGTLGRAPAATDDIAPDRYHYNPNDPTPSLGGPSLNRTTAGRKEQSRRERRRDVLTYTSAPLTDDVTVIGPLTATLHVRSSLEHTDFFVRLCDVTAKGKSFNLSDGIVRLTPGSVERDDDGVTKLEIALWPTANTFLAGHRIRLQVSSGAHPLFNRNAGTGEPLATGANLRSADQELFHGASRPSSLALHVVPLLQDGALGGRGIGSPEPLG